MASYISVEPIVDSLKKNGDSSCNSRKSGNPSSKSEYFLDQDGVLYKRRTDRKHQLAVTHSLIRAVIRANHDPVMLPIPE